MLISLHTFCDIINKTRVRHVVVFNVFNVHNLLMYIKKTKIYIYKDNLNFMEIFYLKIIKYLVK